jgi:uncharacterized protein involved in type VI secretion and phage assembly
MKSLSDNEKLIEDISVKSVDLVPSIAFGKVLQHPDDDHPKKIKVQLRTTMGDANNEVWAEVLTPYAGGGYGYYNIPEIGSEVLVAFAMNNRSIPIVIGNLWTSQDDFPPDTKDDQNYIKCYKTKGGNMVKVSDNSDESSIEVKTIKGLDISLADKDNKITITNSDKSNKIEIDFENKNITIDAPETLNLKVGGNKVITLGKDSVAIESKKVTIKANDKIELSGGQIKASGTAMDLSSNGNFTAKANANISVEATGTAKVKGTILNLN